MREQLKTVGSDLLDRMGIVGLLRRVTASRGGLVLALHRVLPVEERIYCYDKHLVMSEPAFVSLLHLLRRDYHVVPLQDVLAEPRGTGGRPKVAITFDDGWEDNYRIAFPHLLAHEMPATIFACTGLLGTAAVLPEERFARLWAECSSSSRLRELVTDLNHWGMGKRKNDQFQSTRRWHWAQELKRLPLTARLLLLAHLEQRYEVPPVKTPRFMEWGDVRVMLNTGLIRMGSHTSGHATLTSETDRDIRLELEDSRKQLWEHTGVVPEILTYPNGLYNRRVLDLVRATGFGWALTDHPGLVNGRTDNLCVPRVAVRAVVKEEPSARGEIEFPSSRTSIHFVTSWLKSADLMGWTRQG